MGQKLPAHQLEDSEGQLHFDKGVGALVKVKVSSLLWIQKFKLGALGLNVLRQWIYALARDGLESP